MKKIGEGFEVTCADGVTRENIEIFANDDGSLVYQTAGGEVLCDDCAVTQPLGGTLFVHPFVADLYFARGRQG